MGADEVAPGAVLYPDSLVGTDSHTTMIDGLGVAGWGVGGIEAEAVMLGQVVVTRWGVTIGRGKYAHGQLYPNSYVNFYSES